MWRRISVGLTVPAVIVGLVGLYGWLNRPMPPPLGDLTLDEATPPGAELSIHPQPYCDEAVPGFWATGSAPEGAEEVRRWFEDRFGPVHEEASIRLNVPRLDGRFTVYDDVKILVRDRGAGSALWVQTYETTSHDCLRRDNDAWDLENASSFLDACDKLVIEFWGVEYGAGDEAVPPAEWELITFDEGRAIAHGIDDPAVIYARSGADEPWRRYEQGTACYLD